MKFDNCNKNLFCRWKEVLLATVENSAAKAMPKIAKTPDATSDKMSPIQNVLIWLFDGISRSYHQHNLPKTWALLESLQEDGFILKGFNTLGLNSVPNMVPFWTGDF